MAKEAYCSFEVAKLLKEKGFHEPCIATYNSTTKKFHIEELYLDWSTQWEPYISAPTHQMAMQWLREVHGLSVEIFSIKGTSNVCPVFWKSNVVKLLTQDRIFSGELVGSYEEAVEAALKYSLENLV